MTFSSLFCSDPSLLLSLVLLLLLLLFKWLFGNTFVSNGVVDCPWSETLRILLGVDRLWAVCWGIGTVPSVLLRRNLSGIFGYVLVLRSWWWCEYLFWIVKLSIKAHLIAGLPGCWTMIGCWITAGLLPVREWFGVIAGVDCWKVNYENA